MEIPGFKLVDLIGQGAYGKVFKIQSNDKKKRYAAKMVVLGNSQLTFANDNQLSPTLFSHCLFEPDCQTHNIGIFQLFDCSAARLPSPDFDDFNTLTITLICAFQEMLEKKIAHNDIKLSNILVKKSLCQNIFVLSDFSLSQKDPKSTTPLYANLAIQTSSTGVSLKQKSLYYLKDIYCICITLLRFWYKMRNLNFSDIRDHFYDQFQTPRFYEIKELPYLEQDIKNVFEQCPLAAKLMKLVFNNWFSANDINMNQILNLMDANERCQYRCMLFDTNIKDKFEFISEERQFIENAFYSGAVKQQSAAKARRKRKLTVKRSFQCEYCPRKFQTHSGLFKHKKKHLKIK